MFGRRRIFFTDFSSPLSFANLIHRETRLGDYLFERNALTTIAEILARRGYSTAIFPSHFVIIVVNHNFEQFHDGGDLSRTEMVDQLVSLLFRL